MLCETLQHMYLNFPRYVTIANKTLESIQESLSTCPVAPINIMYLNRPRYFTVANNTSKKYPGKFKYLLCGPTKIDQQIYQKSMKNRLKIYQKSAKKSIISA